MSVVQCNCEFNDLLFMYMGRCVMYDGGMYDDGILFITYIQVQSHPLSGLRIYYHSITYRMALTPLTGSCISLSK